MADAAYNIAMVRRRIQVVNHNIQTMLKDGKDVPAESYACLVDLLNTLCAEYVSAIDAIHPTIMRTVQLHLADSNKLWLKEAIRIAKDENTDENMRLIAQRIVVDAADSMVNSSSKDPGFVPSVNLSQAYTPSDKVKQ